MAYAVATAGGSVIDAGSGGDTSERAKVATGKAPFYLKRSAKREMAMQLRFDELRKRGKLDTFMEKKRKKATAKERRWMPTERRGAVGDD